MFTENDLEGITLQSIIKYFQKNTSLQSRQKDITNTRQIIISLKNHTIDNLKNQFFLNGNSINLQKFLWLMKQCIQFNNKNKYQLYYQLVRLFQQIDIDGSQQIQWQQLLQYFSCNGWVQFNNQDNIRQQSNDKILYYGFKQNAKFRKNPIKKIIEIERLNIICIHQKKTNTIQFQNLQGNIISYNLSGIQIDQISSIDYSDTQRLFGIILTNKKIQFIDQGQIQKKYCSVTSTGQQQIIYLKQHKMWLFVNINNTLQIFTSPKKIQVSKILFKPHNQPLTGLVEISNPLALVTSSLDGKIKIWSVQQKQLLIELNPAKEQDVGRCKGIKGICSYNGYGISYLASWTFGLQISIWLPSSSLAKPYIGQLRGHLSLIEYCQFLLQKPILISLDSKRSIRVWQLQTLSCLQTWTTQQDNYRIYMLRSLPLVLIYNKQISYYKIRSTTKSDIPLIQDNPATNIRILSVDFCYYYDYLLILTQEQLKVIQINSAKIITNIKPINNSQQFILMCKKINRRVFLTTNSGYIYLYKIDDGGLIRKFNTLPQNYVINKIAHQIQSQVKFMYFHEKSEILLVGVQTQNYSILYTYDQSLKGQSQRIKQIEFLQLNIQQITFNSKVQMFAIVSDSMLTIWDYQKFTIINKIQYQQKQQIIKALFDDNFGLLFVSTTINLKIYKFQMHSIIKSIKILQLNQSCCSFVLIQNLKGINKLSENKVLFNQSLQKNKFKENNNKKYGNNLLCLTGKGSLFFYDISKNLEEQEQIEQKIIKYNQHYIKQSRKIAIKTVHSEPITTELSLKDYLINQINYSQPHNHQESLMSVCGMICACSHTDSTMKLYRPWGEICGNWSLCNPKPKLWNINHSFIDKIFQRLDKTQKALKKIDNVTDKKTFKLLVILNRYFNKQTIQQLRNNISLQKIKKRKNIQIEDIQQINQSSIRYFKQLQIISKPQYRLNNYFQQEFQKRKKKQDIIQKRKLKQIQTRIPRSNSVNGGKLFKKENITKSIQKLQHSKSVYRIKINAQTALLNYHHSKKDYDLLKRKYEKMKSTIPKSKILIKL